MKRRPFLSTAFWAGVGRIGGLLLPILIAGSYGADFKTDSFFFSYALTITVMSLFSHFFESAMIPHLASDASSSGYAAKLIFAVLGLTLPIYVAAGLALAFLIEPILLISGWKQETAQTVSRLFFEFQPFLWLNLIISAMHGYLYHHGRFGKVAFSPFMRATLVIIFMFAFRHSLGVHALTAGFIAGEIVRALWLLPTFLSLLPKPFLWPDSACIPFVRRFFKDALLQTLALVAINGMPLINQWFAQMTGEGNLSLLSYADRLVQIPYLLFLAGFLQIFHVDWSAAYIQPHPHFWDKVQRDTWRVGGISLMIALTLWFLADPIITATYATNRLSNSDREMLISVFRWFVLGLAPGIPRLLLGRGLIAMKKSFFYLGQAWAEILLSVILCSLFVRHWGIQGIAFANMLVYLVSAIWLWACFHWQFSRNGKKREGA
ncbi:MAG: hypothetical protein HYZ85_00730 [Candidatus Omnitrophica bacterium]|nr:hypothetical protein [Candidatus Omnitrophota bacterium]